MGFKILSISSKGFLSFEKDGEKINILNPRGYSTYQVEKTLQGKNLYFESTLPSLTIEELKGMLTKPNAKNIYTVKQIQAINAEINKKKKEEAEALK